MPTDIGMSREFILFQAGRAVGVKPSQRMLFAAYCTTHNEYFSVLLPGICWGGHAMALAIEFVLVGVRAITNNILNPIHFLTPKKQLNGPFQVHSLNQFRGIPTRRFL
jgi:hypothetical protein